MLQGEHSAILPTIIKLHYFIKIGKISAEIHKVGKIKAIFGLVMTPIQWPNKITGIGPVLGLFLFSFAFSTQPEAISKVCTMSR